MKDHEFREEVNKLTKLAKTFASTDQLRAHMSIFLKQFEEKCNARTNDLSVHVVEEH
jgi:hypothetical protein